MTKLVVECNKCGAYNAAKYSHCISCGQKLSQNLKRIALPSTEKIQAGTEGVAPASKKKKTNALIFLVLIIWFVSFLTVLSIQIRNTNKDKPPLIVPLFVSEQYLFKFKLDSTLDIRKSEHLPTLAVFGFTLIALILLIVIYKISNMYRGITSREKYFKNIALTDELTELYTHRYLMIYLKEEFQKAQKAKQHLAFAITDIDHFKSFNDTYGHEVGNTVLKMFAGVMKSTFRKKTASRKGDILARYGGEEFCIIFPLTNAQGAYFAAERFRKELEKTIIPDLDNVTVTVSIGIASLQETKNIKSVEDLIESADKALYESKETGRNRTSLAP